MLGFIVTFTISMIVAIVLYQKFVKWNRKREYLKACKDGEQYIEFTIAALAFIEETYATS